MEEQSLYVLLVNISSERSSTGAPIVVLTPNGATVLTRILSFAHSQAKFLVSWLIAAAEVTSHTNKSYQSIGLVISSKHLTSVNSKVPFLEIFLPLDAA